MSDHRKLTLNTIERAVRGAVCPACYQRPPGSEALGNDVPRECQGGCPIFLNLPALYRIAVHDKPDNSESLDRMVKQTICTTCDAAPTHGEFCAEFQARTCPLSRFSNEVVALIETLREWQKGAA
jgi:hypothetical protein